MRPGLAPHRTSTANLGAAHPFCAEAGLGGGGTYLGRDLLGGPFGFDPFAFYEQGLVTDPNIVVLGRIGHGKSTLIKTLLWRQAALGRQAWVIDPKGEYGDLARAWGTAPLKLFKGSPIRLNPLELLPEATGGAANLLTALVEASLARPLVPRERAALESGLAAARRRDGHPSLGGVADAMLRPSRYEAQAVGTHRSALAADGRDAALELRRLCQGDLAGMFDAPTTTGVDFEAPLVVVDLSALYGSPALGSLMISAMAWIGGRLAAGMGTRRFFVLDEAWAVLGQPAVGPWLRASWKLSRAWGVSNVAVAHRPADLQLAASGHGSAPAPAIVADSATRVIFAQAPPDAVAAMELTGFSRAEARIVSRLNRGVALWRIGERSFVVRHALSRFESGLVDTDAAMRQSR